MTTVTQGNTGTYAFTGPDSLALTLAQGTRARISVASAAGLQKYSSAITESRNIGPFATGDVASVTAERGSVDFANMPSDALVLSTNYALQASDNQKQYWCSTALTISIPDGLSPRPTVTVVPPADGNLSIAMLGAETVNGATTTQTRARANNVGGVVLQGYRDVAAYGLTGN